MGQTANKGKALSIAGYLRIIASGIKDLVTYNAGGSSTSPATEGTLADILVEEVAQSNASNDVIWQGKKREVPVFNTALSATGLLVVNPDLTSGSIEVILAGETTSVIINVWEAQVSNVLVKQINGVGTDIDISNIAIYYKE